MNTLYMKIIITSSIFYINILMSFISRSKLFVHVAITKRDKEIRVSKAFVQVVSKPLLYESLNIVSSKPSHKH